VNTRFLSLLVWLNEKLKPGLPTTKQTLWFRIRILLVLAWVQIPFAATFADIPRPDKNLWHSVFLFSFMIWRRGFNLSIFKLRRCNIGHWGWKMKEKWRQQNANDIFMAKAWRVEISNGKILKWQCGEVAAKTKVSMIGTHRKNEWRGLTKAHHLQLSW